MQIQRSELDLKDFVFLESNIKTIFPVNESVSSDQTLKELPIDMDYNIIEKPESKEFRIIMDIMINCNEPPLPGYVIKLKAGSIFDMLLLEESQNNLRDGLTKTAIQITINTIRSYLWNVTSFGVFGRFTLPTINLPAFVKAKDEEFTEPVQEE